MEAIKAPDMAYIAVKPCGCAAAIVIDDPDHRHDVGKTVSTFIADGYDVERVTRDVGVSRLKRNCGHTQANR